MARLLLLLLCLGAAHPVGALDPAAVRIAEEAVKREGAALALLADLIACRTVHTPPLPNAENPEFRRLTDRLRAAADSLGFDFQDHGAVVVVGWGDASDRLGLITHGDVQPADPSKWAADPFSLDLVSEPGRLVGRGTEDDKGPIALALHAMAAVRDSGRRQTRRVELIVSYTEESDWEPFREFLARYEMPALNVAMDAAYPVVTGEKGWCLVSYGVRLREPEGTADELLTLTGGAFLSQVPEDGRAAVARPSPGLAVRLAEAGARHPQVDLAVTPRADGTLEVTTRGRSAHSSTPEQGINALAYLAAILHDSGIDRGPAAPLLSFLVEMVGTGYLAERFGDVAYAHPFMGPLTLNLSTVTESDGMLVANLNFRRPAGRTGVEFRAGIESALAEYAAAHGPADSTRIDIHDPHLVEDAPHVDALLEVFAHFTGWEDPAPIAIGGGTHARLVPSGVNFGPSMPDAEYTGHSEHEYVTREQFRLNLKMYTAMLTALATAAP